MEATHYLKVVSFCKRRNKGLPAGFNLSFYYFLKLACSFECTSLRDFNFECVTQTLILSEF